MLTNTGRGGLLFRLIAVLLALALVAAACGDDDDGATGTDDATDQTDDGGDDSADGSADSSDDSADDSGDSSDDSADDSADSSDDSADGTDSGMPEDFDPEGTIRFGRAPGIDQVESFDPAETIYNGDRMKMQLVLGSLLLEQPDGSYDPFMAESYEVVDPQTIVLTLREGVTFSDGAPYDAEAVVTSLKRNLNPDNQQHTAGMHTAFKTYFEDAIADSPTQVTIKLNQPAAGEFLQPLASREGVIVSPKQIAEDPDSIHDNPANAGPYNLVEWDEASGEKYTKNPDFFDPEMFPSPNIEVVYVPPGVSAVQGLTSDEVDIVGPPPDAVASLSDPYVVETIFLDFGYLYIGFCMTKPPFDNLMVRQAVQKGIDREKFSLLAFGGDALPASGFQPSGIPQHNPDLDDQVKTDIPEAERLLAESGVTDLAIDLVIVGGGSFDAFAELAAQDLNDLGFTVNIRPESNIVGDYLTTGEPGAFLLPGSRSGVDKYGRTFFPGSVQVTCGATAGEKVKEIIEPVAGMDFSSPEAIERFHEAEQYIADEVLAVPIVFRPTYMAWNSDNIGGDFQLTAARGNVFWPTIYPKK